MRIKMCINSFRTGFLILCLILVGRVTCAAPNGENNAMSQLGSGSSVEIGLLDQTYHLAFYDAKTFIWEFTTGSETVDNWTTLVTILSLPGVVAPEKLNNFSEALMSHYKSRGAQVLAYKSLKDQSGKDYNYMVAVFDEPQYNRYELDFVKMAMGRPHAFIGIYGVRITDPVNRLTKTRAYLKDNSDKIERALANARLPEIETLPS